jgi:hypothetical protein
VLTCSVLLGQTMLSVGLIFRPGSGLVHASLLHRTNDLAKASGVLMILIKNNDLTMILAIPMLCLCGASWMRGKVR